MDVVSDTREVEAGLRELDRAIRERGSRSIALALTLKDVLSLPEDRPVPGWLRTVCEQNLCEWAQADGEVARLRSEVFGYEYRTVL